ncbi:MULTISPECIES: hypothetical protein [Natrialbaceae]|uniref:hypothetical protein n=1 Tax=Natrialbaceae TaxID=1644061 RepID=UPI00207D2387|nr:hypothetical protein [Natronococcus sp. CG52]
MRDEEPAAAYHLTSPVDFRAALDLLEFDHLIVDTERMLVIFRSAVLNIEVDEGDLKTAERVSIEVLDALPQSAEAGTTLTERFLERLETATGTEWVELPDP